MGPEYAGPLPEGTAQNRTAVQLCVGCWRAGEQDEACRVHWERVQGDGGSHVAVRHASETHPRVQAPAAEHSAHHHAVQPTQEEPTHAVRRTYHHDRRQGVWMCCSWLERVSVSILLLKPQVSVTLSVSEGSRRCTGWCCTEGVVDGLALHGSRPELETVNK